MMHIGGIPRADRIPQAGRIPRDGLAAARPPRLTFALALASVIALGVLVAGCGSGDTGTTGETTSTAPSDNTGSTISSEIETMPADGPGESAALAALPELLDDVEAMLAASSAQGQQMPNISGAQPLFVAYLISVELDGQVTLCEVRADGIAHSLYAYNRAFDSGSLVWTPADLTPMKTAEPQSDRETAAVEAVRAVMADAFPDTALDVAVYGYRFVYVGADGRLLTLHVMPDGSLLSAVVTSD